MGMSLLRMGVLICGCFAALKASADDLPPSEKPIAQQQQEIRTEVRNRLRERMQRRGDADSDLSRLTRMTWQIQGGNREALVAFPEHKANAAPVVVVFHGHGGTSMYAARKFETHRLWPEAICVYPQGLPTPSQLVDPEGKRSGWQRTPGDQADRDLVLFDEILKTLRKEHAVDEDRIYVAGHSNGGCFAYLLGATRRDQLAGVASVGAVNLVTDPELLKPISAFHVAGREDPIVPLSWQQRTIDRLEKQNSCEPSGRMIDAELTELTSPHGVKVQVRIHPGGHEVPQQAPEQMVTFFKSLRKSDRKE